MAKQIQPYVAFEKAKVGIYPDERYLVGKRFKKWREAIDKDFPDEKLSVMHRIEKHTILLPTVAFLCCHRGASNGKFADDYRWMERVYWRYTERFAGALNADESGALYDRMREELQECEQ